ncbi:MAG: hypothetical protein E7553_06050 [Ruminococcaceae bacterium]|nr:hypothetical protein [Oscillospiraceae bacterium]
MLKLLPMPQIMEEQCGNCDLNAVTLASVNAPGLPSFVLDEIMSFCVQEGQAALMVTCADDTLAEEYCLVIGEREIALTASGYKGVYYALQTLRQLRKNGVVPCMTITDKPDYAYRGFYQDVSRGRIPTVETVKRLVDRLASLKYNSLQLYIEHTHRFAEYVGINDDLGYYTDDEILELDRYCREHCIELVPSLSSFGHLYYLLESEQYRHLCEMPDHKPTVHNWHDRLIHHTIDPHNPESLSLITSLIGQYLPLFTSDRFNICCDETFDLCKGKNAGGDAAATYVGFVSQLVVFLKRRGKTVMMWGDIVMQHPEVLTQLPDGIEYLNWCYDMKGNGLRPELLAEHGKPQIICPSVHSHKRFVEKIVYNRPNIASVLEAGLAYGAVGMLNTNWGDYGHLCFDEGMLYGLAYGGAKAWNVHGTDESFDDAVCALVYESSTEVLAILRTLGACDEIWFEREGYEMALWELTVQMFDRTVGVPDNYDYRLSVLCDNPLAAKGKDAHDCAVRLQSMIDSGELNTEIGEALVLAADMIAAIFAVLADVCRGNVSEDSAQEMRRCLNVYEQLWMRRNKRGEWDVVREFFDAMIG